MFFTLSPQHRSSLYVLCVKCSSVLVCVLHPTGILAKGHLSSLTWMLSCPHITCNAQVQQKSENHVMSRKKAGVERPERGSIGTPASLSDPHMQRCCFVRSHATCKWPPLLRRLGNGTFFPTAKRIKREETKENKIHHHAETVKLP